MDTIHWPIARCNVHLASSSYFDLYFECSYYRFPMSLAEREAMVQRFNPFRLCLETTYVDDCLLQNRRKSPSLRKNEFVFNFGDVDI